MNAAILALRTPVAAVPPQAPPQEKPLSAATPADPTATARGARDFAGALDRATAKPGRKDDSTKAGAGKRSGDALPPSGSVTPPAPATPAPAPALPAHLLGPNGAPVAPPKLDEESDEDADAAAPPVAGASTSAAAGAATPGAALSSSSGVDPGGTTAAAASRSPQGAAGAQGAVFADADSDTTDAGIGTETDGAASTSAASGTAQASDATDVVAAAAPARKSSGAATSIGETPATRSSVSGLGFQTVSSSTGAADSSAGGRAATQTDSPSATAAPADDGAAAAQPVASSTLTDLAVSEGSDATGSAASALQAANAAASSPPPAAAPTAAAASPLVALQISSMPTEGAGSASSGSAPDTVSLNAAAVVSLGSGGDARGHNGVGDFGSDTGSGSFANGGGAAALQQLSTNTAPSSSDAAPVPAVSVHADVDSADFPQGVADKVSLAIDNGWSSAKLSVNPPQLGPIELQIAVQGAHAQVAMSTHSAVTREALESSMPKLRDMLNSQGFTQVSVDISQRSFQERSAPESPYGRTSSGTRETAPVSSASAPVSRPSLGMLDTYA